MSDSLSNIYVDLGKPKGDIFGEELLNWAGDYIKTLIEERDGYHNGQLQMQDINSSLIDSNMKYAKEVEELKQKLMHSEGKLEKIRNLVEYYTNMLKDFS